MPRQQTEQDRETRLARLPQWAQDEIRRLQADVDHWKRKATAGPEDSDTFLDWPPDLAGITARESAPVGRRRPVHFMLDNDTSIEVQTGTRTFGAVDEPERHRRVTVTGRSRRTGRLVVSPLGSNTLTIEMLDD